MISHSVPYNVFIKTKSLSSLGIAQFIIVICYFTGLNMLFVLLSKLNDLYISISPTKQKLNELTLQCQPLYCTLPGLSFDKNGTNSN